MNLIQELLTLKESEEHEHQLKAPSFGEMQKAIYAYVIPKFLAAQDKKALADLDASVLHSEASNDRFWTPAFDDAHNSLEKFCDGRTDIDQAIDDIGTAMQEVVEKIFDYYSTQWNFAPGTQLPKLKMTDEDEFNGDEIAELIYKMVPGAKELEDQQKERSGAIDHMHKDFRKLAMQQRIGKEGKAALAPYEDAIAKICTQLRSEKAFIVAIYVSEEDIEFVCRLDTPRGEIIRGAKYVSKGSINVPDLFSSLQVTADHHNDYAEYSFELKEPLSKSIQDLVNTEAKHYTDTYKDRMNGPR